MSLCNLLVHIDDSEDARTSLLGALDLAVAHGAALTGLYPIAGLEPLAIAFGRTSKVYLDRLAEAQAKAAAAQSWLKHEATSRGVAAEWLTSEGDAAVSMAMASRYFDITVTYRLAPALTVGWNVAEEVLLSGGRPCLVLPPVWGRATGARVVVAWNASRESMRALAAALPILEKASSVTVLVGPPRDRFRAVVCPPRLDIGTHLARHGIRAEIAPLEVSDELAGGAILREAYARNADLVVMGAYGRSWTSEWVLGGTTRHVLREAEIPLLASC